MTVLHPPDFAFVTGWDVLLLERDSDPNLVWTRMLSVHCPPLLMRAVLVSPKTLTFPKLDHKTEGLGSFQSQGLDDFPARITSSGISRTRRQGWSLTRPLQVSNSGTAGGRCWVDLGGLSWLQRGVECLEVMSLIRRNASQWPGFRCFKFEFCWSFSPWTEQCHLYHYFCWWRSIFSVMRSCGS